MQTRVAGLIERCQDEVVLEGTLIINDDLNTIFVRYERWLRNSAAAKGQPLPDDQGTTVAPNGVATTSLIEVSYSVRMHTPSSMMRHCPRESGIISLLSIISVKL